MKAIAAAVALTLAAGANAFIPVDETEDGGLYTSVNASNIDEGVMAFYAYPEKNCHVYAMYIEASDGTEYDEVEFEVKLDLRVDRNTIWTDENAEASLKHRRAPSGKYNTIFRTGTYVDQEFLAEIAYGNELKIRATIAGDSPTDTIRFPLAGSAKRLAELQTACRAEVEWEYVPSKNDGEWDL